MGKIKKILENELVGGTQTTDIYPVTSTKAVYDENNKRLDNILIELEQSAGIYDVSAHNNGVVFESLSALLSSSNLSTLIPISVRHGGMSIRFVQSSDNRYVQYRLAAPNWSTDIHDWTSEDPYFINKIMQEVNEAIDEHTPIEIQGNVTNAQDEEDLTSVNVGGTDVLKFKDKEYNPLTYSGIGRKILRKNIVDGVNTLTQEMMSATNTKYVIKYDYILGEDIIIPENCILEFDGGSLNNRMITFSNTTLKGFIKFDNIQVNGNVSNYQLDATIFNKNDIGDSINKCAAICKRIVIPDGIFYSHTKIRLFQHTLCGTNKLDSTTNKGSSIIYTDIDDVAIECTNQVNLSNFRIQNTKNSLLNSIGLKCIGTVNINNIYVANYIKYGFVSGEGLYYSVIQKLRVGMEIGFGIGSIGIYLTGENDSSSTYNANANTFIETICQGGYEVLVKVVGNANTFLGGDFSINADNTAKRQLEILGALNNFLGSFYLENYDKCSLEPICLYETAKYNIVNLSAPRIGKIKNESINYNLIATYDYVSFENDFKYLGENLFDYFFQIDETANRLVSQGYYIAPYYGGNGGINNCQFSLLEEKYKGNSVLRMSFNNSNANNLTFNGTYEFMNAVSSENELICLSAYIRSNIDNATISLSDTKYKEINEWEFISFVASPSNIKQALNGFIKVKSSELLNGYIDVTGIRINVINRGNTKKSPAVDYFNFYKNKEKIRLDYDFLAKLISKGTTKQRPTLQSSDEGFEYYDSTLKKKILWNGSEWTNLDGTPLE